MKVTPEMLARLGIRLDKSLGQHIMHDPTLLAQMVEAAEVAPGDCVLEIGAGPGTLTELLAERARRVIALEIDRRFVALLEQRFERQPRIEVVAGDVLSVDLAELLGADATDYKVVANLPYYITAPIIRRLLEEACPPRLLVITVQREVAERMVAEPGAMSLLAVGVQVYGQPRLIRLLKPGSFLPPPQVESALVRIDPHPEGPPLPVEQRADFFRVVRAAFGQPRKQIKNTLAAGLGLAPPTVVNWLTAAGIDPRRRAETLSVEEWLALYWARPWKGAHGSRSAL